MPNTLILLCRALMAGESLEDPATWKNHQLRLNAILAILYVSVKLLPIDIAPDDVQAIAVGVGMVGGWVVNIYLTVATTDKIGFGNPPCPPFSKGGES